MDKSDFSQHISQQYNEDLQDILSGVMAMGGLVEEQLSDAVSALVDGDSQLGEKVVTSDAKVNDAEVALDEACTHVLARRQPAASDLRLIIAVIKTINDLERIGDEAERVGRMGLHLMEADRGKVPMEDIRNLGNLVRDMVHGALDAFARMDPEQAVRVAQRDIQADSTYDAITHELLRRMMEDSSIVPRIMDVIWSCRALERIGDRARNICEYVVYFVKGTDVRHTSFEHMAQEATGDGH